MSPATPIPAATVVLVREEDRGLEVFLLQRHRAASFMSSAYVFPGGRIDPGDGSAEVAAIRELFEEAGVLLGHPAPAAAQREALAAERQRLIAGETTFAAILQAHGVTPDLGRLHWWSNWVTPSLEPKRFHAQFFIAELPPGQTPSFDRKETVQELWIRPEEALARQAAGTLRLPPPQLRTLHELRAAGATLPGVLRAAGPRQRSRTAICPRIAADERGISIFLPWDPGYLAVPGEGEAIPAGHILATPPSRFVWGGESWREM